MSLPDLMIIPILIQSASLVEARGKGGAANGGGNSWRGGNTGRHLLYCHSIVSLLTAAVFLHSPEDQGQTASWEGLEQIFLSLISHIINQEMELPCGPGSS